MLQATSYHIHRWDDETHFYKKSLSMTFRSVTPEEHTEKVAKFFSRGFYRYAFFPKHAGAGSLWGS
jgi:hypothetical protein